jgi:hypothetical protein
MDTRKEFRAQSFDSFSPIKGKLFINLATAEMAGLAFRFQNWLDVSGEVDFISGCCNAR